MILGDLVRRIQKFFGNNKFSREFGGSCDCPGSSCSKMVKIWMKCTLDNLKVIVALRLKISITSCLNTKSSLIWNFKLSHTVWPSYSNNTIEWYDQYWSIFISVSFYMLWYSMEKLSIAELTCVSFLLAS